MVDCDRVFRWTDSVAKVSWSEFFRCRGIDYKGEEILTAQPLRWENVKGALPDEVGGVPLEEVVQLGSRHYTLNFEDYLLPEEDQVYTKPPRVMIPPDGWEDFCKNLLMKGVFSKVHEDEVHEVKGQKILNCLFGVSKGDFDDGWEVSPLVAGLREEYLALGVPRHPKKGVASAFRAEVQGAIIDGKEGVAYPKPEKILKYAQLGMMLIEAEQCTQKQLQVVGGGMVYCAMFRRPLLGCLNELWKFIAAFEPYPPVVKLEIPSLVKLELARFIGLLPLANMDFRAKLSKQVTASDASETGGGVTVSTGVTPYGCVACSCPVRGDLVEPHDVTGVLTVGLFDGIGALRVAADALGWNVQGHVSVEVNPAAQRVVESRFPNTLKVDSVEEVDLEMVKSWGQRFSQVGLVLIGAGPPCQGVSGLNATRKGALRDARSCLFTHVERIRTLVKQVFPWAQVKSLMESVSSMDLKDQQVMSESFGEAPWHIDAAGVSLARRPRWYWVDWELWGGEGVSLEKGTHGGREVKLQAPLRDADFLQPGWKRVSTEPFPTFTTSRPRNKPGYKPAGIAHCSPAEKARWQQDSFRFPPYQYKDCFTLVNKQGAHRIPDITEREVLMGFPRDYTMNSRVKNLQGTVDHMDERLTLIGNSWNVTVVSWLLSQLGTLLGLNEMMTVSEVTKRTSPGSTSDFQTFLQRPWMTQNRGSVTNSCDEVLVKKLLSLTSIKGEDLMLQASSEDPVKYHRLRASIPAKLWRWRTVAGWRWVGNKEHINVLEMRSVLTSVRWRLEKQKKVHTKFVHLVDSLVCLHALSRGRSSSKKLKRTLLRTNALLLATKSQAVWAYVHTKQNPADAPSRRPGKRKWANA
eukprot:s1856_g1.t1